MSRQRCRAAGDSNAEPVWSSYTGLLYRKNQQQKTPFLLSEPLLTIVNLSVCFYNSNLAGDRIMTSMTKIHSTLIMLMVFMVLHLMSRLTVSCGKLFSF